MRLILASGSPRRLELLRSAGLRPQVRPVSLDETPLPDESPQAMVLRLARAKAEMAARSLEDGSMGRGPLAVVLAADTTVAVDGRALGKPLDPDDAARMLRRLSGGGHSVFTAVAVRFRDRTVSDVCESRVVFAPLSDEAIATYVATGEPMDKAGAYGIQAGGGRFVTEVEGSYTNVVGLPMERLEPLLALLGLALDDLRAG